MPLTVLGVVASLFLWACSTESPDTNRTTVAVIPKGTSHVFWQSVHAGAVQAARELDIDVIWRGAIREDDRESQISELEGFISRGVDGIVLAPLDDVALRRPVVNAGRRGIPVVIIDSALRGQDYVSFVATDNRRGGQLAGEHLGELLRGRGRVVMLRYAEGHASTTNREEGFLEAIRGFDGIEVVSSNQYGGADVEGAYKKGENLLSRFKAANGGLSIDGIFCPNESSVFAMLRVLQDNGWAGTVRFVGFDSSSNLARGLREGDVDALVLQDPMRMGYVGVKSIVSHLAGENVPRRVDTGVVLATAANMDSAAIKALLEPDLTEWLGE